MRTLRLGLVSALLLALATLCVVPAPALAVATQPDGVYDGATSTASLSNTGTLLTLNTTGYGYLALQFTSVGSGNSVAVETSSDGTAGTGSTFVTAPTTVGTPSASVVYYIPVTGSTMRVRVSSYTSGAVTVYATLKRATMPGQAVYNLVLPTFTAGQRGDLQLDSRGDLLVGLMGFGGNVVNVSSVVADGGGNIVALGSNSRGQLFNNSGWDRQRSAQGLDGTGLGVAAVEEGGRSFSEITTATSTAVATGGHSLHTVTLNTCVASATVKIYNALTATGTPITITCPSTVPAPFTVTYDAWMGTGVFVVTSGPTDVTVTYR